MMRRTFLAVALLAAACGQWTNVPADAATAQGARAARTERALFAGGCFWCTESDFERLPGVIAAVSGYTGGRTANPTYAQVSAGGTGHYEAVLITYDPARIGYAQLVRHYFRTVDPTDAGGQFCDRGESYRTAIFALNPAQRRLAEAARAEADRVLAGQVVTPVIPSGRFYPAEDYHQDYYRRNPVRYRFYRWNCGRDARLRALWGAAEAAH